MIIYVSNATTASTSATIRLDPTEDVAGRICSICIEQFFLIDQKDFIEISCSLTQVHSQAFKNSSTQTGNNTCILFNTNSSGGVLNNPFTPSPRLVYVPTGPTDVTFTLLTVQVGIENPTSTNQFGFLVSLKPFTDPKIPATIYATSTYYPFTINYACPPHLADKTVMMKIDSMYDFMYWQTMVNSIPDLTQPKSNFNFVVFGREKRRPDTNVEIPVYLPSGPIPITFTGESLTPDGTVSSSQAPATIMTANNLPSVNGYVWVASSSDASATAYQAFASLATTTWTSAALYNASTGAYTGTNTTTVSGTSVTGEWLQLQLPFSGSLITDASWTSTTLGTYVLAGSNNGTSWETLEYEKQYSYVRLIMTSLQTNVVQRFPPSALTSGTQTVNSIVYEITKYEGDGNPYALFDYNNTTGWYSLSGAYSAGAGTYVGTGTTTVGGTAIAGNWVQIKTSQPFIMKSYIIRSDNVNTGRTPTTWTFAGSLDGVTWTSIDTKSNIAPSAYTVNSDNISYAVTINNPTTGYTYYRFIVNKIDGGGAATVMYLKELEFYGTLSGNTFIDMSKVFYTGTYISRPRFLVSFREV